MSILFRLILPVLLILTSCSNKCYQFDGSKTDEIRKSNNKFKGNPSEIINMGGWSGISEFEFLLKLNNEKSACTRYPRERRSEYYYQDCKIKLLVNSNNDTGNDRMRIFSDSTLLYQVEMTDQDRSYHFDSIHLDSHHRLTFIVDNITTKLNTPGAFEARIKIKELK